MFRLMSLRDILIGMSVICFLAFTGCSQGEKNEDESRDGASLKSQAVQADPEEISALIEKLHEDTYFMPRMGISSKPGCGFSKTMLALKDIGPAVEPFLVEALDEGTSRYQASAIMVLAEVGQTPAVEKLESKVSRDSDDEVLLAAVTALGKLGDPKAGPVLLQTLQWDDKPKVRIEACKALGALECREAFESLIELLESRDPELRAMSFYALKEMSHRELFQGLLDRIEKSEGQKRILLIQVIGAAGSEAIPELSKLASFGHAQDVRCNAVIMLSRLVPESLDAMTGLLQETVDHDDARCFERLARTLANNRHPPALPVLEAALNSSDPAIKKLSDDLLRSWETG
ncbi:HEAT repeat domain-containing protein [Acidobacteriota bacterium]